MADKQNLVATVRTHLSTRVIPVFNPSIDLSLADLGSGWGPILAQDLTLGDSDEFMMREESTSQTSNGKSPTFCCARTKAGGVSGVQGATPWVSWSTMETD